MNKTTLPFKKSVLPTAISLVLGLSMNLGQAAVSTTGNNFTMLQSAPCNTIGNCPIGGTNDVAFSWDETFRFSVPVSGNVSNATVSSVSTFFGHLLIEHDVTIYGPGTYNFEANCPAGEPGCTGSTVYYVPKRHFHGTDSFTYAIVDARGGVATATVHVTVNHINHAPIVNPDLIITDQNAAAVAITPLSNDSDIDGDALTISAFTQPTNGAVIVTPYTFAPNSISYTPTAGFSGIDSFTYSASDGNGGHTVGTVYVGVNQTGNSRPVVSGSDVISAHEDNGGTATALTKVSDLDGDPLTILYATNGSECLSGFTQSRPPAFPGGDPFPATVSCTLYSDKDFNGTDSFSYAVTDGKGGVAIVPVTVTISPINDKPVGNPDVLVASQDAGPVTINPLLNDVDVDGDALHVSGVTQPVHGAVTFTDSSVSYTPMAGFSGIDSFTYTANDGTADSNAAMVTVGVNATGNSPPAALDDNLTVNEDSIATNAYVNSVYVLNNDSDLDSDRLKTIAAVSRPANGTSSFFVGKTLTMTVGPGQVGGHMLIDWNGSNDMDFINVWNMHSKFGAGTEMIRPDNCGADCGQITTDPWSGVGTNVWDGASTDEDGDGTLGIPFVDGPFASLSSDRGNNGNFNLMGLRAVAAPTANAGSDSVAIENTTVTLSGTCANVDAPVTACVWSSSNLSLTPGSSTGLNSNSATGIATFTAPVQTVPPTTYTVTLTTTDITGTTATDDREISIAHVDPVPGPATSAGSQNDSSNKNSSGCSMSPKPVKFSQRSEWWLIAGFLAWLGGWRFRRELNNK